MVKQRGRLWSWTFRSILSMMTKGSSCKHRRLHERPSTESIRLDASRTICCSTYVYFDPTRVRRLPAIPSEILHPCIY